jgi:outer membrane usher protein
MLQRKYVVSISFCLFFAGHACSAEASPQPSIAEPQQRSATPQNVNLSSPASKPEFNFDNTMFRGTNINQDVVDRLSKKNSIEPGNYNVAINTNGRSFGQERVTLALINGKSEICLSDAILTKAGFLTRYQRKFKALQEKQACVLLSDIVPEASVELDSQLSLNFTAPQAVLKTRSGDYVETSSLEKGETVLFTNYAFNQYHSQHTGGGNSDYSYLNLSAGINLGLWQYRQLSTYSYNHSRYGGQSQQSSNWHNIAGYVQRALPDLQSRLVAGQTNTTGQFLSGLSYTGVEIASDERMLPSSQQGYAPIVSGIAKTNALVEVRQNGAIIYQTTVSSGAFEIRDLNPTSFNGDLEVTVREADGSISTFNVPFSAVPDSVRPGRIKYSVATGQTRGLIADKHFIDGNLQYGINNTLTLGGGTRIAKDYSAGVISSVFSGPLGAFGINATYSNANITASNKRHQGWMSSLTYSKSLQPTNTNISLAGYRYSTEGYREFTDFINEQYNARHDSNYRWDSTTYLQHYRLMMTVAQPLGQYGNISLSASTQEYRDNRPKDLHYQANYSKMLGQGISMNINVSRQTTSRFTATEINSGSYQSNNNTLAMLSFNIPLGGTRSTLSTSATFDRENGNAYQTSLGGSVGSQETPYNYSLNVNYDQKSGRAAYAANLNKQYSMASASVNASKGRDYWQGGAGVAGAVVLHRGGLVAGPYLGDTFAIIEAKGAEGAKVFNGQGATVNRSGYALVPSLVPYRYNSIGITPDGMRNNNVDIESAERRIAPYSGAAVKVTFATNEGYPLLIRLNLSDGTIIPMGAIVVDDNGQQLGLVGQNNQAYIRTPEKKNTIKIFWGERPDQQCTAEYSLNASQVKQTLIKLSASCR